MTLVGCRNMKLLLMMIDSNGDVQIGIDVGDRRFSTHLAGKKKKKQEQEGREKEEQASSSRNRQRRRFFLPEKNGKENKKDISSATFVDTDTDTIRKKKFIVYSLSLAAVLLLPRGIAIGLKIFTYPPGLCEHGRSHVLISRALQIVIIY